MFYAASMTMTSLAMTAVWLYAIRRRLLDDSLSAADVRGGTVRSLVTSAMFLLSIGAAFLGIVPAVLVWVVALPIVRGFSERLFARA